MTGKAITLAAAAVLLAVASTAPSAAPVRALSEAILAPAAPAVYRGGNWNRSQLDAPGAWREHNRLWDEREGKSAISECARRYGNAYDPNTRTYRGRDGRRHRCPR
jgi:hypothetical protein